MTIVGSYENCGSRSAFYVIDDERGFKEFDDKEDAEYAHSTQAKLSKYNLAPEVLSQVGKIRYSTGDLSGWGYMTEIAEMIGCGGNECSCGDCDDDYTYIYSDKINTLADKMLQRGFEFMDAHIGNVGYIRRKGRKVLVCIDFGEESVYDEETLVDEKDDYCGCEQCKARKYQNV